MPGEFAKKELYDPRMLADYCRLHHIDTSWFSKVNRFENPIGVLPGTGAVLMRRKDLDDIDLFGDHDLTFIEGDDKVTAKRLHISGNTVCLTPAAPDGEDAVHLVPVADHRDRFRLYPINDAYNLRLAPTGPFSEITAQTGTTGYTWQQILDELWELLPEDYRGTTPDLPSAPAGTPEQFPFYAVRADGTPWLIIDAVGHVLHRLGMDLAWDHSEDVFSYVRIGPQSENEKKYLEAQEKKVAARRLWDLEPVNAGLTAASVGVVFRKNPTRAYGNSQFVVKEVDGSTPLRDGELEGGTAYIRDDLVATYQGRERQNDSDLNTRADARALDYFRVKRDYVDDPRQKFYSGVVKLFKPDSLIEAVTWHDRGGSKILSPLAGLTTEVRRLPPFDPLASWPGNQDPEWRYVETIHVLDTQLTTLAGYRDAVVVTWDTAAGAWVSLFRCWGKEMNGNAVIPGRYVAHFYGSVGTDSSHRPVYGFTCCPVTVTDPSDPPDPTDQPVPGEGGDEPICCTKRTGNTVSVQWTATGCALDGKSATVEIGVHPPELADWVGGSAVCESGHGQGWSGSHIQTLAGCTACTGLAATNRLAVVVACCLNPDTLETYPTVQWAVGTIVSGQFVPCASSQGVNSETTYTCDPISIESFHENWVATGSDCCDGAEDVTVTVS